MRRLSEPQANALETIIDASTGRGRRGLNTQKVEGSRSIQALLDRGLVEVTTIPTGKHSTPVDYFKPTPAGREALEAVLP